MVGKAEKQFQKQIQRVRNFNDVVHTEFELDKCAKIVFKTHKIVPSRYLMTDINREIQELQQGKTYYTKK